MAIYSCLKSLSHDGSKQQKHAYTSLDDDDALIDEKNITDWSVTPDKLAENSELGGILDEAIKKLAPDYRVVFMLRDIQGFQLKNW